MSGDSKVAQPGSVLDDLFRSRLVVAPGGLRSPESIRVLKPGETARPVERQRPSKPGDMSLFVYQSVGHAVPNWIASAYWFNQTGRPLTLFQSEVVVPNAPGSGSQNETLYYFIGLQDHDANYILQPVLQWGGDYPDTWSIASWLVPAVGDAQKTPSVVVAPGARLASRIVAMPQPDGKIVYQSQFDTYPQTQLNSWAMPPMDLAVVVLEAYGISSCSDYPVSNPCTYDGLRLAGAVGELPVQWSIDNRVTNCGQRAVPVTQGSPNGRVDLFCR